MNRWLVVFLLALFSVSDVLADVAPPPGPQAGPGLVFGERNVRLVVKKDDNARVARLLIPAPLLTTKSKEGGVGGGRLPAMMAGLALTAAFVSLGFGLVCNQRRLTAVALVISLFLFGGAALQADVPPGGNRVLPPQRWAPVDLPALPVAMPATVKLEGKLVIEVVPAGDSLVLIVPSRMVIEARSEPR